MKKAYTKPRIAIENFVLTRILPYPADTKMKIFSDGPRRQIKKTAAGIMASGKYTGLKHRDVEVITALTLILEKSAITLRQE